MSLSGFSWSHFLMIAILNFISIIILFLSFNCSCNACGQWFKFRDENHHHSSPDPHNHHHHHHHPLLGGGKYGWNMSSAGLYYKMNGQNRPLIKPKRRLVLFIFHIWKYCFCGFCIPLFSCILYIHCVFQMFLLFM